LIELQQCICIFLNNTRPHRLLLTLYRIYHNQTYLKLPPNVAGSIVAAHCLAVQPGDKVLDMCAAPGGKSLILAEALGHKGTLVSNDVSPSRSARLSRVLKEYIPVLFANFPQARLWKFTFL
jgi:ubiquinone/menaquinone biosynthesis C-methylase UbiE